MVVGNVLGVDVCGGEMNVSGCCWRPVDVALGWREISKVTIDSNEEFSANRAHNAT